MSELSGSMVRIEKMTDPDVKITMQPVDVHVGAMKNFQNIWIIHDGVELMELFPEWKDVDDVVFASGWNLHETCHAVIAFVAMLKINSNLVLSCQLRNKIC